MAEASLPIRAFARAFGSRAVRRTPSSSASELSGRNDAIQYPFESIRCDRVADITRRLRDQGRFVEQRTRQGIRSCNGPRRGLGLASVGVGGGLQGQQPGGFAHLRDVRQKCRESPLEINRINAMP